MHRLARVLGTFTLIATVLVVVGAGPAQAAPSSSYYGTRSPMDFSGTDYTQPDPASTNDGVWFFAADGTSTFVEEELGQVAGIDGSKDVHAGLTTFDFGAGGKRNMTVYVDQGLFDSAGGGPYAPSCSGFDALFEAIKPGGLIDSTCVAFKKTFFAGKGSGADYEFQGYGGFRDATDNPVGSDPDRASGGDYPDPGLTVARYQGSASPFTYGGTDFTGSVTGESGAGASWLPMQSGPLFVSGPPKPLPSFPAVGPAGQIASVHAVLLDAGAARATLFVDGALFSALNPSGPFDESCPGFEDFLTAVGAGGITCVAFGANVFSAPTKVGEDFTCEGVQGNWTDSKGDPVGEDPTITEGFEPPALTPIGVTTGPGVCVLAETAEPEPTTTVPPTPVPTPTTVAPTPAPPPPSNLSSGTPSTLPATGSSSWALVLAGALAIGLGIGAMALRPKPAASEDRAGRKSTVD